MFWCFFAVMLSSTTTRDKKAIKKHVHFAFATFMGMHNKMQKLKLMLSRAFVFRFWLFIRICAAQSFVGSIKHKKHVIILNFFKVQLLVLH